MTAELMELIKEKNKIYKDSLKQPNNLIMREQYSILTKKIEISLKLAKEDHTQKYN